MRIHRSQHGQRQMIPLLAALLGVILPSSLAAQPGHIVLIRNSRGQAVYINTSDQETAAPKPSHSIAPPSSAEPGRIQRIARQAANRFKVDPRLVDAVIRTESGYDSHAVSPKGALGLMQLIPATAERFGVENPFDPRQNIQGGVHYLRYLLNTFNGNVPLAVAAYNAGENSVLREGGVPRFPETVDYVQKVTARYGATRAKESKTRTPQEQPIYQYADAQGVMHFTNDGGF
ncbi:MAG TPA: lytic transglycosylase domain-containing protein [Terriglobia bacterium]|nr:lytic transglycosylase domain-containing protein [Terriglobia bacterium]